MTTKHVPLGDISIDGGTQARAAIHAPTVAEYAEALSDGETLPPAVVFFDGAQHHLADGFHRLHANLQIGATTMECEVRTGTLQDARLYAYGANRSHGLRRTNDDKRKAVLGMLADCPDWSDRAIAKHVGVSHPFVAAIRSPQARDRQADARDASAAKTAEKSPAEVAQQATDESDEVESDSTLPPDGAAQSTPKVESDSTPAVDLSAHRIAELEQMAAELLADNNSMTAVFEADDKLVTALAENKRLRAEVGGLRERVNGLMGEKNEAIRLMKSWRKKAEAAAAGALQ
jgi:hypothetical protein